MTPRPHLPLKVQQTLPIRDALRPRAVQVLHLEVHMRTSHAGAVCLSGSGGVRACENAAGGFDGAEVVEAVCFVVLAEVGPGEAVAVAA
jgi:hypothetical protein